MASVTCIVQKGDLPLNISWAFNGKSIKDNAEGITIVRTNKRISQLNIDQVSAEAAGRYACIAENSAGQYNFSANLNVNGI